MIITGIVLLSIIAIVGIANFVAMYVAMSNINATPVVEPTPRKTTHIKAMGKYFTTKSKLKPKYKTDADLWKQEQDDR